MNLFIYAGVYFFTLYNAKIKTKVLTLTMHLLFCYVHFKKRQMITFFLHFFKQKCFIFLLWYEAPLYCDILPMNMNNEIKNNFFSAPPPSQEFFLHCVIYTLTNKQHIRILFISLCVYNTVMFFCQWSYVLAGIRKIADSTPTVVTSCCMLCTETLSTLARSTELKLGTSLRRS